MEDLFTVFNMIAPALLVFARIIGLFVTGPVIGGMYVPMQIKTIVALTLTFVIAPMHMETIGVGVISGADYLVIMARELLVGIAMGFLLNLFIQGLRFGGDIIGRTAGFAAAEMFDPSTQDMRGPVGEMFGLGVILLFFLMDGHLFFITALDRSFAIVPLGTWQLGAGLHAAVTGAALEMFQIALTIAFPVLAVIFSVTMAEGVIARAVPQINILHITFATKIMTAFIVLYLGLPSAVVFMGIVLSAGENYVWDVLPTM